MGFGTVIYGRRDIYPQEPTRYGLLKEREELIGRSRKHYAFQYAFADWAHKPTKKKLAKLRKAYNALYGVCVDQECECPWKDEAWVVNKIRL